jgi:RNA polymerase sigma-70 factor (ECF subfamily)
MLSAVVGGTSLRGTVDRTIGSADASGAVGELYARHATALYAFGRRLGLDEDEAWDAVQEAHVRLWRALAEGREVHDGRAWLATATYRLAIDQHRLARRLGDLRRRLGGWSRPGVGSGGRDATDALAAWTAVDALPLRQRAAIYLHYRLDLPYDDVGRVMGISPGAARVSASRGLAAVRAALGVTGEGADE